MLLLRDFGTIAPREVAALRDRLRARRLPADAAASRARSPRVERAVPRATGRASAELWLPAPEAGARHCATRRWPRPTSASSTRPRRRAPTARRRSRRARRAWREGFVAEAIDSPPTAAACSPAEDLAATTGAHDRGAGHARVPRLDRLQDGAVGPGAGAAAAARAARRLRARGDGRRRRVRPHGGRVREARVRRPRRLLRRQRAGAARDAAEPPSYARDAARAGRRRRPPASCAPGLGRARSPQPPRGAGAAGLGGHRRADARRHLPPRRRRPPRQPRLRHAERRLAAELAGDAGPRLLPRHARADVLARSRASRARSRPAGGRARRSRRRCALHEDGTRLAFGTPGGDQQDQWSLQLFLDARRPRAQPAGGDRRAGVPHRSPRELVLPARDRAAAARTWRPASAPEVVEELRRARP